MFDKVKAIFEEQLGVSQDEMKLDTNFKDDLGVDSLDLYEIVMKLEDEFDVEIPAEPSALADTFESSAPLSFSAMTLRGASKLLPLSPASGVA